MRRASRSLLESGERRVLNIGAHPWVVLRPALPLAVILLLPVVIALLDEMLPWLRLSTYTIPLLWGVAALALLYTLFWLITALLPWLRLRYTVTDRRLIVQSGVLSMRRWECPLYKVQETDYRSEGLMARLFDMGDVTVETAGGHGAVVLRGIGRPKRIQALISAHVRVARDEAARRHVASMPNTVLDHLRGVLGDTPTLTGQEETEVMRPISDHAVRLYQRLNLLPNEAIIAATRRHLVVLFGALLAPLTTLLLLAALPFVLGPIMVLPSLLVAVGGALPWAVWRMIIYYQHEYILTTDRLMELRHTPFLFQMRDIVSLNAVQNVVLEIPSLLSMLADLGNIVVEVETGDEQVILKTVPHPARLQKLIFESIESRQRRLRENDDEQLASTLSRWFDEYHRLTQQGQQP